MDPPPKSNDRLAPDKALRKRPSTEAVDDMESKKRAVGEARISHPAAVPMPTDSQVRDLRISPDPDDPPTFQQIEALTTRPRILRKPNLAGEKEQSTWACCCHCNENGPIMSWPQCRRCLHNRCPRCEYSESIDYATEAASNRIQFAKLNELSGEIMLVLESLTLTSAQKNCLPEVWEAVRCLIQKVSELEDAGVEASGTENTLEK